MLMATNHSKARIGRIVPKTYQLNLATLIVELADPDAVDEHLGGRADPVLILEGVRLFPA